MTIVAVFYLNRLKYDVNTLFIRCYSLLSAKIADILLPSILLEFHVNNDHYLSTYVFDSSGKKAFLAGEFDKYLADNKDDLTIQQQELQQNNNHIAHDFYIYLKNKYSLDKD